MIHREDMLELTRRMTPARSCFDRIAGAYIDDMGEVDESFNIHFGKLSASEKAKNLALAKAVPFSSVYSKPMSTEPPIPAITPSGNII